MIVRLMPILSALGNNAASIRVLRVEKANACGSGTTFSLLREGAGWKVSLNDGYWVG